MFFVSACAKKEKHVVTQDTQVYFVGGGIAGLSGAYFAIKDGKIPGKNVHVFQKGNVLGGALAGSSGDSNGEAVGNPQKGYVLLGARKYDNTEDCYGNVWYLMKGIPGMNNPDKSLYDEFVEFNKKYVKHFQGRFVDKDKNVNYSKTLGLSWRDRKDLMLLTMTPESWIENRSLDSWFQPSFFRTNLWYVFSSIFGMNPWHDLVEARRYFRKFSDGLDKMIGGTTQDLEVVHPVNQYESLILPLQKLLAKEGVDFKMGCKVTDLDFKPGDEKITVDRIHYVENGVEKEITVRENDFVIVTNGSKVADTQWGSMKQAPDISSKPNSDGSWSLWEKIAAKKPGRLGNPSNFDSQADKSGWMWYNVTTTDPLITDLIEKKTGNKTGFYDMVSFPDSPWFISVQVPAQPHFLNQPKGVIFWDGLGYLSQTKGTYVKKRMIECSGEEILTEIAYQFGFEKELPRILATSNCIPVYEPYVTAQFLKRKKSDRPLPVPQGSTNLGFTGQFVESGECVFLVEASVRSSRMAVYELLNVDKKVPPAWEGISHPKYVKRLLWALFQ